MERENTADQYIKCGADLILSALNTRAYLIKENLLNSDFKKLLGQQRRTGQAIIESGVFLRRRGL